MTNNQSDAGVTQEDFAIARAVVDSKPVISTFAACEWDEFHDDGKVWLATVVREARQHAIAQHEGGRGGIIKAVVDEAEQACRYAAKRNVANMDAGEYRDGFETACEVCESAIAEHVQRHDDRIPMSGRGEPGLVIDHFPSRYGQSDGTGYVACRCGADFHGPDPAAAEAAWAVHVRGAISAGLSPAAFPTALKDAHQ